MAKRRAGDGPPPFASEVRRMPCRRLIVVLGIALALPQFLQAQSTPAPDARARSQTQSVTPRRHP